MFWKPLAGLALFLLALALIEEAASVLAGARTRRAIHAATEARFRGVFTGTLTTAILQSSSLVGLLVLAFVGAGIMKLRNALSDIFYY